MIRNTSLPQRMRAQAQLQLSQMHCYTRPTQIKNRCIIGGKGRGVFRAFRMARVGTTGPVLRLMLTDACLVPIPDERVSRQSPWC